jgi:TrmH family RNA methyltransferase
VTREIIQSRSNAIVRRARAVRDGKERGHIFVEGVRLCEEAARSSLSVEDVLHTERLAREDRGARLLEVFARRESRLVVVSEPVFASLSDTQTPQGVVALARRPATDRSALEATFDAERRETPLLVLMHRVNNPSNAGAMFRVAEAAGANGIISTEGSTDLYSPKALRGAMGSSFRLPVWAGASFREALAWCAARGIRSVATDVRAAKAHTDVDWTEPLVVVVGEEGSGLERTESEAAELRIKIPMRPPVESLNIAAALAVILYEAARQRADF